MDSIKKPIRDKIFGISSRKLLSELPLETQKAVKMIFEQNQSYKEIPLDIFFNNICSIMGAEFASSFFNTGNTDIRIDASFYRQIESICQNHNILPFKIKIKPSPLLSKDTQDQGSTKEALAPNANSDKSLHESVSIETKETKKTDCQKNIPESHYKKLPGEDIDEFFV